MGKPMLTQYQTTFLLLQCSTLLISSGRFAPKSGQRCPKCHSLGADMFGADIYIALCQFTAGQCMMTSPNGNFFRVTGPLCGEFPSQRPVTRSFDVFFDLCLNKRLSKQSGGWWFETPSRSLWCHCNGLTCHCVMLNSHILKNYSINIPIGEIDFHKTRTT